MKAPEGLGLVAVRCPGLAAQVCGVPFLWTASSMSGCLVTITTLTISVLPPWRIMFTTCRWPTFTTFCPFTCGTGVDGGGMVFSFRIPSKEASYPAPSLSTTLPSL